MAQTATLIGNLEIRKANTFFSRLRGLLFTDTLTMGQALLIIPCQSIHTFGMKYNIHVIFLSKDGVVLRVCRDVKPNGVRLGPKGSYSVIEVSNKIDLDKHEIDGKRFIRKSL